MRLFVDWLLDKELIRGGLFSAMQLALNKSKTMGLGASVSRVALFLSVFVVLVPSAHAISLRDAVSIALDSNPEIGQAIENREAIEFELRQARGLYLPRVDLDASYGVRQLDSPGRRRLRIDDDELEPHDIGATVTWRLFDGFGREAEIERQASRVDGASLRVYERSEFIALAIAKEYFELLLQQEIIGIANENLDFHQNIRGRIESGVGKTYTTADDAQSQERLEAARARVTEAREAFDQARIRFFRLVAKQPSALRPYRNLSGQIPQALGAALKLARENNPRVRLAEADIDAAAALVKKARARYYPEVLLEGRALAGHDIDGVENRTEDYQARVVAKWNIYNGGIDVANEQEQVRRLSEERMRLHSILRETEENVKAAWNTRRRQGELHETLEAQAQSGQEVVDAYDDQFGAGRRTLLDLLSAQNTYFNTSVLARTAGYSEDFAAYRILASIGELTRALHVQVDVASEPYARAQARVPATPLAETMRRYSPNRSPNPWHPTLHRQGWTTTVTSGE